MVRTVSCWIFVLEVAELVVALLLVHHQRVALSVCLQADGLAHVHHPGEMLHPVFVDGLEHDLLGYLSGHHSGGSLDSMSS